MPANQFGNFFQLSSFGESHGAAMGVVIDGCPSGVPFDLELLQTELDRRRPGTSSAVSARSELDQVEVLSGVFEGQTLGTPIAMLVRNQDARSQDYKEIAKEPRIGHADDTWSSKYGHRDHRGGGRSSGRETVSRVMAGAVAQMFLRQIYPELQVKGEAKRIGPFESGITNEVMAFLEKAKIEGKSYGGTVGLTVKGMPKNLGQPVFHKLKSDLASAILSIGATTGFELGAGFSAVEEEGSEFHSRNDSEVYGGIRGGISTGEDLHFSVAFKPTSSVKDVAKKGRHDPCIVPRAIPVVEAMTWLVLADHELWRRLDQL